MSWLDATSSSEKSVFATVGCDCYSIPLLLLFVLGKKLILFLLRCNFFTLTSTERVIANVSDIIATLLLIKKIRFCRKLSTFF